MQVHRFDMQAEGVKKGIDHGGRTPANLQVHGAFEHCFVFQHQRHGNQWQVSLLAQRPQDGKRSTLPTVGGGHQNVGIENDTFHIPRDMNRVMDRQLDLIRNHE